MRARDVPIRRNQSMGARVVTFDFSGAQVLVTGGTSGIGYAIAQEFLAADARVVITGTRATAADYETDLSGLTYRQLHLTEPTEITALAASLTALDVLVNNAGQVLPGGKSEYDPEVFATAIDINLIGAFRVATACQPLLQTTVIEGGASIVNLASMSSYFGVAITPGYGAAKTGIVGLTRTLANAWAGDRIRVNAVAPGVIETAMTAPMLDFPDLINPMLARTPMGRIGTPADIAPVVAFLASPAARFITGQTIAVDGGFSIQA